MTSTRLDNAIAEKRKIDGVDYSVGFLDGSDNGGDPRLRDGSGRMYVRFQAASGYTRPVPYPVRSGISIPPNHNLSVKVGWDDGEECITEPYRNGIAQSGTNPGITNPSDPDVIGKVQTTDITEFRCTRSLDAAKPWSVRVETGYIEIDGVAYLFPETEFDFDDAGLVPSAGEKCLGAVFLNTDLTLSGYASTPVLSADPLPTEALDECRQQADPTSMSIWGWVLEGDLSGLTDDPEKNMSMRPTYTMPVIGSTSSIDYFPIDLTTSLTIPTNKQIVTGSFTVSGAGVLTVNGKVTVV